MNSHAAPTENQEYLAKLKEEVAELKKANASVQSQIGEVRTHNTVMQDEIAQHFGDDVDVNDPAAIRQRIAEHDVLATDEADSLLAPEQTPNAPISLAKSSHGTLITAH